MNLLSGMLIKLRVCNHPAFSFGSDIKNFSMLKSQTLARRSAMPTYI